MVNGVVLTINWRDGEGVVCIFGFWVLCIPTIAVDEEKKGVWRFTRKKKSRFNFRYCILKENYICIHNHTNVHKHSNNNTTLGVMKQEPPFFIISPIFNIRPPMLPYLGTPKIMHHDCIMLHTPFLFSFPAPHHYLVSNDYYV